MNEGDVVVVTGKLDTRVRDQTTNELIMGTVVCVDKDSNVWVLLPSGDFWRGPKREVCLAEEQIVVA